MSHVRNVTSQCSLPVQLALTHPFLRSLHRITRQIPTEHQSDTSRMSWTGRNWRVQLSLDCIERCQHVDATNRSGYIFRAHKYEIFFTGSHCFAFAQQLLCEPTMSCGCFRSKSKSCWRQPLTVTRARKLPSTSYPLVVKCLCKGTDSLSTTTCGFNTADAVAGSVWTESSLNIIY